MVVDILNAEAQERRLNNAYAECALFALACSRCSEWRAAAVLRCKPEIQIVSVSLSDGGQGAGGELV